jgi:ABC-type transporter Mla subunit MlaD
VADIAELGFRVDSSGLVRAANDLERLNRAAASAANNRVRIAADVSGVDAALREIERLAVNRSIRIDANVTGISEALRDLDRLSGGARGVRIDVAISGVEAAVRGLRDIERLAVNRTVRIDIDMGDIGGAIRDLERLAQQARDAAAEINGLGSNVNVTSGAFGNLGGVLSTVLSGGALAVATTAMIEQARQLTVLSNAYDVSTNSIQTWQAAAKPLGIEADKIGDIFKDVSDKIGDFATTGGGEAKDMFEMLGLSIEEFKKIGRAHV